MTKTIKYNLANFRHIRSSLPMDVAKTFIHGLIFSHISYCITCWGQANESTIRPLKSQYKQALKILDKKPLHYHHCNILEKHNLLSFENFREFSNLCLVYKILHGLAPACLLEFVCHRPARSIRSSRISSIYDCRIPTYLTTFGQSSFSFNATTQWNSLSSDLKSCPSFRSFKTQLKHSLKNSQNCNHWCMEMIMFLCSMFFIFFVGGGATGDLFIVFMCMFMCFYFIIIFYFILFCFNVLCPGTADVN